jgi:hypothetical protein
MSEALKSGTPGMVCIGVVVVPCGRERVGHWMKIGGGSAMTLLEIARVAPRAARISAAWTVTAGIADAMEGRDWARMKAGIRTPVAKV